MKNQLKQAIIDGNADTTKALAGALLATGASAREILDEALLPGMEVVGERMRSGACFIPEVLLSARVMQGALELLEPHMAAGDSAGMGTVVIGTVEGDLHDIGKNLVGAMLEGAGFEVVDLGVDIPAPRFVSAVRESRPQIVGLSALLTTTMPAMKTTIEAFRAAGIREQIKIMVGGALITKNYADSIGADGYSENAAASVDLARRLTGTH